MQGHSESRGQLSLREDLWVPSSIFDLSSDDSISGRGGLGAVGRRGVLASFCVCFIFKVVEPAGFLLGFFSATS